MNPAQFSEFAEALGDGQYDRSQLLIHEGGTLTAHCSNAHPHVTLGRVVVDAKTSIVEIGSQSFKPRQAIADRAGQGRLT
jgi:hypothetical protein